MAGLNRFRKSQFCYACGFALWLSAAVGHTVKAQVQPAAVESGPLQQGPPLKVTVSRVSVGVTVTDSGGRFVSGLQRKDFRIFDDDVEQPITDFLNVEAPAQVLLLIEAGPAVLLFAKDHVLAADQMVASLAPDDLIGIATYTSRPEDVIGFTSDKGVARTALRGINFMQGFGDLNMLSSVTRAIDVLSASPGKKTIVLLSTGLDTSPNVNWNALREKLRTADVRILAISLSGEIHKPARRKRLSPDEKEDWLWLKGQFAENDQSLRDLSQATGGRAYFVKQAKDFPKTYAAIADLLRHEYSLGFAPTLFDGKVHTLRVEVNHWRVHVAHRPAYLAASHGSPE